MIIRILALFSLSLISSLPAVACYDLVAKVKYELEELGEISPKTYWEVKERIDQLTKEMSQMESEYYRALERAKDYEAAEKGSEREALESSVRILENLIKLNRMNSFEFIQRWWNPKKFERKDKLNQKMQADLVAWRKDIERLETEWRTMQNDIAYIGARREAGKLKQVMEQIKDEIALLTGPVYSQRVDALARGIGQGHTATAEKPLMFKSLRDLDAYGMATGVEFGQYRFLNNRALKFRVELSGAFETMIKNRDLETVTAEVEFTAEIRYGRPELTMRFPNVSPQQAEQLRRSLNAMMAYRVFHWPSLKQQLVGKARGKLTDPVNEFGAQDPAGLAFTLQGKTLEAKVDLNAMMGEAATTHSGNQRQYVRDLIHQITVYGNLSAQPAG